MNRQREIQKQYDHALDRMYLLFKAGRERETELEDKLELARDELMRVRACPGADEEIKQLCERGLNDTKMPDPRASV